MKTISLTQGKIATVDDEDYDWLTTCRWYPDRYGYAIGKARAAGGKWYTILMHREIYKRAFGDIGGEYTVHHINDDRLDNRKGNLQMLSRGEHVTHHKLLEPTRAKSGVRGVRKVQGRWTAQITANGHTSYLGCFDDIALASHAYSVARERANRGEG